MLNVKGYFEQACGMVKPDTSPFVCQKRED